MSISSDFAGLAGLSVSTIGTAYIAGEVGKSLREFAKTERKQYRRASHRKRR